MILNNLINDNIDKTNSISEIFLSHACQGRFIEKVIHLYKEIQLSIDIYPTLNQIASIEHSSETDFLFGMIFGLNLGGINE
jgi:hypothetical protein